MAVISPEMHTMGHFTNVCLVAWPLNKSKAGVDLVLIEMRMLFLCKFLPISIRTVSLTEERSKVAIGESLLTSLFTFFLISIRLTE